MTQNNAKINTPSLFIVGGDLSGNTTTQVVSGLQGRHLSNLPPADGYSIIWNASHNQWEPAPPRVAGRRAVTNITSASTHLVLPTEDYLAITTLAAAFTITLPVSPTVGDFYEIKDITGLLGLYNVTINGNGHNIDGSATFVMSQPYENVKFIYNNSQWSIG